MWSSIIYGISPHHPTEETVRTTLKMALLVAPFFVHFAARADTEPKPYDLMRNSILLGAGLVWHPPQSSYFTSPPTRNQLMNRSRRFCDDGDINFYWNSSHPGGDRGGLLNEKNRGLSFECPLRYYLEGHVTTTMKVGGLFNSQYGNTFLFGGGVRITSPEFYYVSFGLGAEVDYIYYEHPRRNRVIHGPLPVISRDISIRIPGWCLIRATEHRLADTGVKLYSRTFSCEVKF
jgi:hypothetical protein